MKKIYYSLIGFACLLAFSCASAPKKQVVEREEVSSEETAESKQDEGVSENDDLDQGLDSLEENLLEERITEDELPELPELPDSFLEDSIGESEENEGDERREMPLEPVSEEESDVESLSENLDFQLPPETDESGESEAVDEEDGDVSDQGEKLDFGQSDDTEGLDGDSNEGNETDGSEESSGSEEDEDDDYEEESHLLDVKDIKPSRSISVNKFQILDVGYPGQGWIYQGCVDSDGNLDTKNQNFVFYGRKLGGNEQLFSLMAKIPGKYYLHFFKSDVLTGEYIDDYLEVEVVDSKSNGQKHVLAPSYAQVVPPKATISADTIKRQKEYERLAAQRRAEEKISEMETKKDESGISGNSSANTKAEDSDIKTVIQNSSSGKNMPGQKIASSNQKQSSSSALSGKDGADDGNKVIDIDEPKESKVKTANLSSDALLLQAKKLYDGKNYAGALDSINAFFEKSSSRIDEALYLQGQILEAKSDVQNIKGAIDSYDLLVRRYPASPLWNQANKRSIFLKRFYINIR